ncbi:MAG: nucleoside hydrolase [Verrucomicrobiota bacterium]
MKILLALTLSSFAALASLSAKPRVILDADTANEIDDLYAIARMLRQEKFELIGLNSAQWIHYLGERDSVAASQSINEDLLRLMDREDLPAPLGSDEPMGKPWGGTDPKDSAAAQFIIQQARATAEGEKLIVICIGASTNLASALKLDESIVPKVAAYVLGFRYNLEKEVWDKSEFNIRRDLNAADFLLNCEGLELHVMPVTVAIDLRFEKDETFQRQAERGKLGQYLSDRWMEHSPDSKQRIMWDLALVEAMISPDLATQRKVTTPPENTQREVWIYDSIDSDEMESRFWEAIR